MKHLSPSSGPDKASALLARASAKGHKFDIFAKPVHPLDPINAIGPLPSQTASNYGACVSKNDQTIGPHAIDHAGLNLLQMTGALYQATLTRVVFGIELHSPQ